MHTTDGEQLLLCVENIRVLDLIRKPKALSATPEGTIIGPVSGVHVAKILDRYGANTEYTTHVVISSEEERFVNGIHDHKQELRSSNELLASLPELGRNEERTVTRSPKETWTSSSTKETCEGPVILTPRATHKRKDGHNNASTF